jgi:hypothetical protein
MKEFEEYKPIIVSLVAVIGVIFLLWVFDEPTQSKISDTAILVNQIKVKQGEIDSLKKELEKSNERINYLLKLKHEKTSNYKPLQRPIFTDSLRTINIQRFY